MPTLYVVVHPAVVTSPTDYVCYVEHQQTRPPHPRPSLTNGTFPSVVYAIKLTDSGQGWLWSRVPLTAQNWIIEVEFKIHGESTHLYGDGLAMWLTKTRAQPGPVFGSIDNFEGLGIFLDT